ncbi:MAG: adenylyl-sulfate kinase [Candidatus Limnocylindria bacterium]
MTNDPIHLSGGAGTEPGRDSTGFTIWFTGMSGSGKSTVTAILERELRARDLKVEVLDGDVVRTQLTQGLGFSREDRDTNIRRIGWVCELLSRNDVIAIAAVISPYRATRDEVRQRIGRFVEVYMEADVDVLAKRDVKGLYRKAAAGEIPHFTGVSDVYEPPLQPDVTCFSDGRETPARSAARVLARLEELGYISPA